MKNNLLRACLRSKSEAMRWKSPFKLLTLLLLLSTSAVFAQTEIKGVVSDAESVPLPGVNILVKGTGNGTISDFDGNFSLQAQSTDVLVFTFIGYKPLEVAVGDQKNLKVSLDVETSDLSEVIIVGYGVKKKSLVTGAISSVDAEDLKTTSASRADAAMQGKTAGVMILPTSGSPGASSKIRIRGTSSNGNSNPLFIVDGMKTGDINNISPSDIENIQVLKDAASSAIYGTEGANGVVLITTKSGKKGVSKITYDFMYGVQSSRTKAKMMNAEQYKQWHIEASARAADDAKYTIASDVNNADTDWLSEGFQAAPMKRHNVSFSGGSEKTSYFVSSSYLDQDGIVGGSQANYSRYTFRTNIKSQVKNWLEVGSNLSYNHQKKMNVKEDDEYGGLVNSMLLMDPLTPVSYNGVTSNVQGFLDKDYVPVMNSDGKYYGVSQNVTGEITNPLATLDTYHNFTEQDKLLGTAYAKITPLEGFSFTSRIGLELTYQNNEYWAGEYYLNEQSKNTTSSVDNVLNKWNKWVWENFATYTKEYKDNTITALLGYSAEKYEAPKYTLHSGTLAGESDAFAHQGYATGSDFDKVGGEYTRNSMASLFARLSYDYKGKYLLEASIRRDGASQFPTDKKYGVFPAISAGWVVTNEEFFKVPAIDYLKVRASWGQNGSRANLPGNEDIMLVNFAGIRYPGATGGYISGASVASMPNSLLTWERTEMTDIGLDFRFLANKLSVTLDYYSKVTKDLITKATPNPTIGATAPNFNAGDVTNKGFDLELGYKNYDNEFKYSVNLNMSFLKNEVTSSGASPVAGRALRGENIAWFEKGQPIWYFQGYKTDGILDNGNPNVVDVDGDGKISPADKTFIGSPHPDILFGGNVTLDYKGFDFLLSFQGSKGNDIFMGWFRADLGTSNKPAFMFEDRWTASNPNASMPAPSNSDVTIYNSDLMVQDGSYLRIKQVQVGYTLPTNIVKKVGISNLRAYLSMDNYFTFTKYKGLDPEAGSNSDNSLGIDRGVYPAAGIVSFGLSLSL